MDALLRRRQMMAGGASPTPSDLVFYGKLVFDGTAFIKTDLVIPANGSIRVSVGGETVKGAQRLYYAGENGYQIFAYYGSATNNTNRSISVYYDSNSVLLTKTLAWTNASLGFYQTPKSFGFGNARYTYTKGSTHPTTPIEIGGHADVYAFTGYMTTFYIYGSDAQDATSFSDLGNYTPVYTLKPCTYYGEAGLWCVETNTFYGNTAGAGTLSVANFS